MKIDQNCSFRNAKRLFQSTLKVSCLRYNAVTPNESLLSPIHSVTVYADFNF